MPTPTWLRYLAHALLFALALSCQKAPEQQAQKMPQQQAHPPNKRPPRRQGTQTISLRTKRRLARTSSSKLKKLFKDRSKPVALRKAALAALLQRTSRPLQLLRQLVPNLQAPTTTRKDTFLSPALQKAILDILNKQGKAAKNTAPFVWRHLDRHPIESLRALLHIDADLQQKDAAPRILHALEGLGARLKPIPRINLYLQNQALFQKALQKIGPRALPTLKKMCLHKENFILAAIAERVLIEIKAPKDTVESMLIEVYHQRKTPLRQRAVIRALAMRKAPSTRTIPFLQSLLHKKQHVALVSKVLAQIQHTSQPTPTSRSTSTSQPTPQSQD